MGAAYNHANECSAQGFVAPLVSESCSRVAISRQGDMDKASWAAPPPQPGQGHQGRKDCKASLLCRDGGGQAQASSHCCCLQGQGVRIILRRQWGLVLGSCRCRVATLPPAVPLVWTRPLHQIPLWRVHASGDQENKR